MNKMMLYKILRPLVYVLYKIVYKPEVINKEYIPKEGRCILAGTHTNNLDFISVGMGTKRPVRYVAKDELMKGIKKYFFKAVGIIPVNRRIHDKSVIPTCVDLLNKEEFNDLESYIKYYKKIGYKVLVNTEINDIKELLKGKISVFTGQSGAGFCCWGAACFDGSGFGVWGGVGFWAGPGLGCWDAWGGWGGVACGLG